MMANFLEPIQLTNFSLDIDNLLVNKQGTRLAFSCQVYANLTIEQTAEKQAADKASGSLVYKFDKLFIRHWYEYMLDPRHHPRDVLFGVDSDSPTRPFGDGRTEWSFSASGNRFAFTRQHDETSAVAWSTNLDIFTVDLTVHESQPVCITTENKAADTDPRYSPVDEDVIIYRAQAVPGYESDQFKIKLFNCTNRILPS